MRTKKQKEMMKEAFVTFKKTETDGWFEAQQEFQKQYDLLIEKAQSLDNKIFHLSFNIRERGQEIWLPGQPAFEQNGWNMSVRGMKSLRPLIEKQNNLFYEAEKAMKNIERYEQMMLEDYEQSGQMEEDEQSIIQALREVDVFYAS